MTNVYCASGCGQRVGIASRHTVIYHDEYCALMPPARKYPVRDELMAHLHNRCARSLTKVGDLFGITKATVAVMVRNV